MQRTNQQRVDGGFITLEILIAMTVLVLTLSATTLLMFSNLSVLSDGTRSREAQGIAENLLANERERSLYDFKQVNNVVATTSGIYVKSLQIETIDYFTKRLTALVSWVNGYNRTQQLTLSEVITDFTNTTAEDTCDWIIKSDWSSPRVANSIVDFATLAEDSARTFPITDIDVYRGRLYVTTNNTSSNQETFFIFDILDPTHPTLISKIDNDLTNNTGIKGLFVHGNKYETYAYVANSSSFVKGQLQIIDASSTPPTIVSTYKIPTAIVTGSSGQGSGNSIFYKDGYVYLGLTKTISGPEFNIIDVHDPRSPRWVGGYSVDNSINNLYIKDGLAYLVTPNAQELITLDITDPVHPIQVGSFDAPDSIGSGKSLYLVGNTLYLGRTVTSSHPELYLVDNSTPTSPPSVPLGTEEIGSSVNSLLVRSNLLFLITTSGKFQIFDVASTTSITSLAPPLVLPNTGSGSAMDCERDTVFVASVPSSGLFANKGAISIFTAR